MSYMDDRWSSYFKTGFLILHGFHRLSLKKCRLRIDIFLWVLVQTEDLVLQPLRGYHMDNSYYIFVCQGSPPNELGIRLVYICTTREPNLVQMHPDKTYWLPEFFEKYIRFLLPFISELEILCKSLFGYFGLDCFEILFQFLRIKKVIRLLRCFES